MKETYIAPKVEVVEFDSKIDIICTSGEMTVPSTLMNDNISSVNIGSTDYTDLIN